MKGIDISYYQGNVDFSKIKKQFEYVIIRLGLGDNVTSQDDVKYKEYIEGCKKYGIPYAFYFVSYAKRLSGSESVQSEIAHTERCMKGYEPFALFYDMEIESTAYLGKNTLTNFAITYCDYFKNKGYKVGVYANLNWFRNYLDYNTLKSRGYLIWLAHYTNRPGLECDIWQYADNGNVDGINTNTTDLDIMYTNIINNPTPEPTTNINIYYAVKTKKYGWLPEVKNLDDYAGYKNDEVNGLKMRVDVGSISYRGITVSGKKLGWVSGCDINDYYNGWSGTNTGEALAVIEAEYLTPKDIAQKSGYKYLYYKVNDYPYQIDLIKNKSKKLDGYAGKYGTPIRKFQAEVK